jgi:hypothetical protein
MQSMSKLRRALISNLEKCHENKYTILIGGNKISSAIPESGDVGDDTKEVRNTYFSLLIVEGC